MWPSRVEWHPAGWGPDRNTGEGGAGGRKKKERRDRIVIGLGVLDPGRGAPLPETPGTASRDAGRERGTGREPRRPGLHSLRTPGTDRGKAGPEDRTAGPAPRQD